MVTWAGITNNTNNFLLTNNTTSNNDTNDSNQHLKKYRYLIYFNILNHRL